MQLLIKLSLSTLLTFLFALYLSIYEVTSLSFDLMVVASVLIVGFPTYFLLNANDIERGDA